MPLNCPSKVRYRVKKTSKGNVRLAFCSEGKVVEAKKLEKKAKKRGQLGGDN